MSEITIMEREGVHKGLKWKLTAETMAQSAFKNEVTLDEFHLSLNIFSKISVSSVPQIQAWRDEACELFFGLLEEAGMLKMEPAEFLGGSDYEEDNGTTPDIENK